MNDVNIGFKKRLDGSLSRIDTDWNSTVNSRDFKSVSRFGHIHQVIIKEESGSVRGLARRDFI